MQTGSLCESIISMLHVVNEEEGGTEQIRLDCKMRDYYSNISLQSFRKDVDANGKCGGV